MSRGRGNLWLYVIGVGKLLKAATLIVVGIGALRFAHGGLGAEAARAADDLRLDAYRSSLLIVRAVRLDEHRLHLTAAVTFAYAALFLVEGTGLVLRRRWGEYVTIAITGSFLPIEAFELYRGRNPARLVLFVTNLVIVAYLVWRVRGERRREGIPGAITAT